MRWSSPITIGLIVGLLVTGLMIPLTGRETNRVVEAAPDITKPILRFEDRNLATGVVTRVEIYTDVDTAIRFRRFVNDVAEIDRPATTDEVDRYTDYKDTVLTDAAWERFRTQYTWLRDQADYYTALRIVWDGLTMAQKEVQLEEVFRLQALLHDGLADLLRVLGKHKDAGG